MRRSVIWSLSALVALAAAGAASAEWAAPEVLWPELWDDPGWFDLDDQGQRLVALIPFSNGYDNYNGRSVVTTERVGGVWQPLQTLATNGTYSDQSVQVLPQRTTPVISGDGGTIAYLGWNAGANGYSVYLSDRGSGGWSAPEALPTGLANHHYWLSLSTDGDTLALCNYPYSDTQHVYVMQRDAGGWGGLQQISGASGGGFPSLSGAGTRVAFVANTRLMVAEHTGSTWGAAQALTSNDWTEYQVEYPRMSRDGSAIHYWLVDLDPGPGFYLRVAQNLFLTRRDSNGWSAPQQVNGAAIEPAAPLEWPAAADAHATRLVYPRAVTETDPQGHVTVVASHLEVSELSGGVWQESRLLSQDGPGNYNKRPWLAPDGLQLVFDAGIRYTPSVVYNALWEMTTTTAPPAAGTLFADGFESGGLSGWSSWQP